MTTTTNRRMILHGEVLEEKQRVVQFRVRRRKMANPAARATENVVRKAVDVEKIQKRNFARAIDYTSTFVSLDGMYV